MKLSIGQSNIYHIESFRTICFMVILFSTAMCRKRLSSIVLIVKNNILNYRKMFFYLVAESTENKMKIILTEILASGDFSATHCILLYR